MAKIQAVSASATSFKLHSIKAPSIVNFENGDSGVEPAAPRRIAHRRGSSGRSGCGPPTAYPSTAIRCRRTARPGSGRIVRRPPAPVRRPATRRRERARRMGVGKFAHHQAADLAGRMSPLTVGKAVQGRIVAVPGQGVKGREAAHRKGGKVLTDAFSVLLPLGLDRTPGPVRVLHRQQAHD